MRSIYRHVVYITNARITKQVPHVNTTVTKCRMRCSGYVHRKFCEQRRLQLAKQKFKENN